MVASLVLYNRYGLYLVFDNRLKNPCTLYLYTAFLYFKKHCMQLIYLLFERGERKKERKKNYTRKKKSHIIIHRERIRIKYDSEICNL